MKVKLLDYDIHTTTPLLEFKFERNLAFLDLSNNSPERVILCPSRAIGIVDLRSMSHYKIKQGDLQQGLRRYFEYESLQIFLINIISSHTY